MRTLPTATSAELGFTITVERPEPADTAPVFSRTVEDQSYTVGEAITLLELPAATGGNGEPTPSVRRFHQGCSSTRRHAR